MERLIILGCGSALPASKRNPTAQILEHSGRFFLIDCGEGTQSRLRENKLSFDKITHIFISHMHGDHYLGLPGLISSMQLLGRRKDLHLYGPKEIMELLEFQFRVSKTFISFELKFTAIDDEVVLIEDDQIIISTIKLNHRISCYGFKFEEKLKPRRINGPRVKEVGVPHYFMVNLRAGEDFITSQGEVVTNEVLTFDPKPSFSYAFCSDNRVKSLFHEKLKGITHLYHEATFLHKEHQRAKKTYHTTVKEACELAQKVKPKQLILGHFSARYKEVVELQTEADEFYENSILAEEGMVIHFNN